MDTLREEIRKLISIWALNGSEFPDEPTDEIMALVWERINDERRDAALEYRD
jgi:hypothetical protein